MSQLRNSYRHITNAIRTSLSPKFKESGGSSDLAVNGSVMPVDFLFSYNVSNSIMHVGKITIILSGDTNAIYDDFGDVAGPLPNGSQIFSIKNNIRSDFSLLNRTADFYSERFNLESTLSLNGTAQVMEWTLNYFDFGDGVILRGNTSDALGITINDDLTGLVFHEAYCVGYSKTIVPIS